MPSGLNDRKATQACEDVFKGLGGGKSDCTEAQKSRYYSKISGPLLDRIDIQIEVPEVKFRDIVSKVEAESSEENRRGKAVGNGGDQAGVQRQGL